MAEHISNPMRTLAGCKEQRRQFCDRRGHRARVRAAADRVRELLGRQGSPGAGAADCLTNLACV